MMRAPGKRGLSSSVTAIICAVALAACGASHQASSGTDSAAGSAALKFANCIRALGVPSFPDPTRFDSPPGPILILGHSLFFRVSPGFDPTGPPVKRAVAACGGS